MSDVDTLLAANREAVREMIAAAERCGAALATPRAPGKWSPSQVVEHVARSLDESANVLGGLPSKFPNIPFFIRPVVKGLLFNRVLRTGTFPKAKTNKAMNPDSGPATPAEARQRLEAALERFERECRTTAAAGRRVASSTFGSLSVADYARFTELHTRHHCRQMPGSA